MIKVTGVAATLLAWLFVCSNASATEYLVKYKNNAGLSSIMETARAQMDSVQVMDRHAPGQYVKVDIAKKDVKTLAKLMANKNIEWVVPNFKLHAYSAPVSASALQPQWAIAKVQAEKAWARAGNKGSHDVVVAVIDTGTDYNHKNLKQNMVQGFDFNGNDNDPMDETGSQNPGHGTHCAGIIGATGLVEGGTVGMGPGLSIMPIRFLGADGGGDLNNGIKSIDYAIEKGAKVISASWGAAVPRAQAQALVDAVIRADNAGVIFVAAAANDGANNDSRDVFPANVNSDNMISVAASGETDAKPSWSNYGKAMVHLASPGEGILSTLPRDAYGNLSGTSMATPLVSGLVGFLKSQDPTLTGKQIRALLQVTGVQVGIETACNCRVDAFNAVDHLLSKKPWLVPAAGSIGISATLNLNMMNGTAPFTFTSSNPAVLTVDNNGLATGVATGSATVSVTDASGATAQSLQYNVGVAASTPPPGGGDGECPLGDPAMCQMICTIMPDLPWCH